MAFGRANVRAGAPRTRRRVALAAALTACVAATLALGPAAPAGAAPQSTSATKPVDCVDPDVPAWWHDTVANSIAISKGLPESWASSRFLPRIVCWQGTNYDRDFRARNGPLHVWHGIFAMTIEELETMQRSEERRVGKEV